MQVLFLMKFLDLTHLFHTDVSSQSALVPSPISPTPSSSEIPTLPFESASQPISRSDVSSPATQPHLDSPQSLCFILM